MTTVFFNEIHYENIGLDINEGIEVAGPAGLSLDGWNIFLYNGRGDFLGVKPLRGLIPFLQNGYGVLYFKVGLPNDRDGNGIALISPQRNVVHFISWGREITNATGQDGRPLADVHGRPVKSQLLPVEESAWRTFPGQSLQLQGSGSTYEDFHWVGPIHETFGGINSAQTFIHRRDVVPQPKPKPTPVVPAPAPVPVPAPSPAPTGPAKPQAIQSIDLFTAKNRAAHHTDKFRNQEIVLLRRGQKFDIGIVAGEVPTQALVKLQVYPETNKGSAVEIQRAASDNFAPETDWFGYFSGSEGKKAVITIHIPGRAIVGQYILTVSGDGGKTWTQPLPIYILFNAWSQYDDVFLDDEAHRNEYVLGEEGYIWVGNYYNNTPRPWSFAPFATKSLQAGLEIIQRVPVEQRHDVVLIARALSALVNVQDDNGVLVGNWSSDFSGGTPPTGWTGSEKILSEYVLTKKPVRYAQCWVFSGTLTTVCRVLGIPARSVSNFASAHDVPDPTYNRSVDHYFLDDGVTEDTDKTSDSVWNFHVWNDVWMARRDLGEQYRGFQAIDSTPQEKSGGKFQLGPVPLIAVKNGEKGIKYDLEFVYSEVNADENYYVPDGKGGYKLVRTITDSIGKNTSTKAVGTNARHDVTLEYKYAEGTPQERASHGSTSATAGDEFVFNLDVNTDSKLGEPIKAALKINPKHHSGTVQIQFAATVITYTGKQVKVIQNSQTKVDVSPNSPTEVPFVLLPQAYIPHLKGTDGILFRAFIFVSPSGQTTIVQRPFDFLGADLEVTVPQGNHKVGEKLNATVKFTNPLNIKLNNLVLTVEGNDLTKLQRFKFQSLNPHESITQLVPITLWARGKHTLIAQLDTDEVNDLGGHTEVTVA